MSRYRLYKTLTLKGWYIKSRSQQVTIKKIKCFSIWKQDIKIYEKSKTKWMCDSQKVCIDSRPVALISVIITLLRVTPSRFITCCSYPCWVLIIPAGCHPHQGSYILIKYFVVYGDLSLNFQRLIRSSPLRGLTWRVNTAVFLFSLSEGTC